MNIIHKIGLLTGVVLVLLSGCNDLKDINEEIVDWTQVSDSGYIVVLNEGLFNLNNSSLTKVNFTDKRIDYRFFEQNNNRGLGDTGNDLQISNNLLWVVVNISSQIEVIDPYTGISLRRIPMFTPANKAKQPRFLAVEKSIYVCSFDGSVDKIDPLTLEITHSTTAGKNPDGICFSENKVFVSNSGGLDAPDYDSTISVFEASDLSAVKHINAGLNPGKIAPNSLGDVYVIVRGNTAGDKSCLKKINKLNLEVEKSFPELAATDFCIVNDTIYAYYHSHISGEFNFFSFDTKKDTIINAELIKNTRQIVTPYSINFNLTNRCLYISDAKRYTSSGSLHCFDENGVQLYELKNLGLNPSKLIFFN